jgi:hypothetical protein
VTAQPPTPWTCPACGQQLLPEGDLQACRRCSAVFRVNAAGLLCSTRQVGAIAYPEAAVERTAALEADSYWFRHRNQALRLMVEKHAPTGTLWDIGGGNGFQAQFFQGLGRRVVLVEPGPGAQQARARGVNHVLQGTLESLELGAARMDVALFLDVLEHIPDPGALLATTRAHMSRGAPLVVTVPAFPALWSDEDLYAQHQRRYTRGTLRQLLERAGFKVAFDSYFFMALALPVAALRALPYRLGRRRSTMNESEHRPGGLSQQAVEWLLGRELPTLQRGGTLPFGSSVIAVARRE